MTKVLYRAKDSILKLDTGGSGRMDFGNLIHKGIMDDDRWIKMPLNRQIGNIGAEVSRIFHWKNKSSEKNVEAAFERALELIDLSVYGLQKSHNISAMRELLRFREVLEDQSQGDQSRRLICSEVTQ